mmetsp:Transcript_26187/g.62242  ORF Transcript_26187/g.62242 Transcript_26187/m.62242 type:complete len:406 (+) Transcript_26187:35-1252(+)
MAGRFAPRAQQLCAPALLCFQFLNFHSRSLSAAFVSNPMLLAPASDKGLRKHPPPFQRHAAFPGFERGTATSQRFGVLRSLASGVDSQDKAPEDFHISVLRDEVLDVFSGVKVRNFIDGTLGMGGHLLSICENNAGTLELLIGIDQDPTALQLAGERLSRFQDKTKLVSGNFADIEALAQENGMQPGSVDGILLDIGTSSLQLDEASRGFSFMRDGPLDMRMDPNGPLTAADICNYWSEEEIAQVLWEYGEERKSRSMAKKIVKAREEKPIETTLELCKVIGGARHGKGIHPATLAFQGLRIAVNRELHVLSTVLPQAVNLLGSGGRLAVISFHSLEDRIVKQYFRDVSGSEQKVHKNKYAREAEPEPEPGSLRLVTKRPITAQPGEEKLNPRSRSAKLRVLEKV